MAESAEQVLTKIRRAVEPGFRGTLTSRGIARAMVWRGGVVPSENQKLGQFLSQDLLSYGYALLRLGLQAKSEKLTDEAIFRAFELAGASIEGVVKNGDPTDEARGFHRVTAAASYHLGRFSARAYSLLQQSLDDINISNIERGLALLILRDLDGLYTLSLNYAQDPDHSDEALIKRFVDKENGFDLDDVLIVSLTENYLRALAAFVFSIRLGEVNVLDLAQERLVDGEELAFHKGFVSIWWIYRLTRFLIDDLWEQSMQKLLPKESNDSSRWPELRKAFLSSLSNRSTAELELWPSQVGIASRVLDDDDNIVASLPTSAGKTRIAELCILRTLSKGQRIVFITPLRSLSAQTERSLWRSFSPLGYTVSALYGSAGSSTVDTDNLANRDIVVSTPEKLDFALRNNPDILDDVGLVVLDEGHMLGPSDRDVRYEVLVQRLLRRPDAASRRLVCLSAMLPSGDEMEDFVSWIRADNPGQPIKSDWRPTRLNFGEITWQAGGYGRYEMRVDNEPTFIPRFVEKQTKYGPKDGVYNFPSNQNELAIASAWRLVDEGLSVLIYCPRKPSVGALAKVVIKAVNRGFLNPLPIEDPITLYKVRDIGREWLGVDHVAVQCLELGVAIHHASLPRPFLRQLDVLIQQKKIKLVISSPTISRGLNISASCVLFQSFSRGDSINKSKLISAEEFSNVAGRAGRAFVDVDGQVLGICFTDRHLRDWKVLVDKHSERKLESGIIQLVRQMWERFKHKIAPGQDPTEYVLNNSQVWDPPSDEEIDKKSWQHDIAILDTALLSLIGDQDCTPDEIAVTLDLVLTSSFLRKQLQRATEARQRFVNAVLESRAKYIWTNSTPKQRKGYFFAGLGFRSGQFLDEHSSQLNHSVLKAEEAIRTRDVDGCLMALLEVARIVFQIEPFRPEKLPKKWEEITIGWLRGEHMSTLNKLSEEATAFIESGLVYRLVWAVEAVRVRSRALDEGLFDERPSPVISVIETGTASIPASILLQLGLQSRVAAIKALEDFPSDFETPFGMQEWLLSDKVQSATNNDDWPTGETHPIWQEFVRQSQSPQRSPQKFNKEFLRASFFDSDKKYNIGEYVLIRNDSDGPKVYSPDLNLLGIIHADTHVLSEWLIGSIESETIIKIHLESRKR